jgi:hypothetical protein
MGKGSKLWGFSLEISLAYFSCRSYITGKELPLSIGLNKVGFIT